MNNLVPKPMPPLENVYEVTDSHVGFRAGELMVIGAATSAQFPPSKKIWEVMMARSAQIITNQDGINPDVVLSPEAFDKVVTLIANPPKPPERLRKLMQPSGCPNCGPISSYIEGQARGIWQCFKCSQSGVLK